MLEADVSNYWIYIIKLNCALPHAWKVNPPRLVESPWLSNVNYDVCFTTNIGSAMRFDNEDMAYGFIAEHQHIKEFIDATVWKQYRGLSKAKLIQCFL